MVIVIFDDDIKSCNKIKKAIRTLFVDNKIYFFYNLTDVVDCIERERVDVLIMELEMKNENGISSLIKLNNVWSKEKPFIIINTKCTSKFLYDCARRLGVDYVSYKGENEQYSGNVAKLLNDLIDFFPKKIVKNQIPKVDSQFNVDINEAGMTEKIIDELNEIGVSAKTLGYKYLVDAILMVIEGENKNICTVLANKYGETSSSVERAMKNAINRVWDLVDADIIKINYKAKVLSESGAPTINEFIYYYAYKIMKNINP